MMTRRTLIAFTPLACLAQETGPVDSPKFKIVDLKFRVEDMGGKVEDIRIKETAAEVRIEMSADVLFDFDKAIIKPQAEVTLNKAATLIRDRGKSAVRIEGHTDAKGSDSYNQKLSMQRAEAVQRWLVDKGGIDRARLTAEGMGAKKPVAPNTLPNGADDPAGRQRNRRVELIISK